MPTIVTGGAGFIGSTLVDRLLGDGHDVVVVDNFDLYYAPERKQRHLAQASKSPRFRLVDLDIRNRESVHRLILDTRPEVIVHLAARAGVRPSILDPAGYVEVNVGGTTHLLEAASQLSTLPRFVFASSSSVYGDRLQAPFRESDPVDLPVSPYAATKKACELMGATFHHLYGLPVTGLRLFTAYGPRNRPDLAIAKFADLIEQGKTVPMFGDGSTLRDYTFVGDIVDGIVKAIQHCQGYQIYNLGNATPVPLLEMIQTLGDVLGKAPQIERLPEQPGDVRQTHADISRAHQQLGYAPATTLRDGLTQFVTWLRSPSPG